MKKVFISILVVIILSVSSLSVFALEQAPSASADNTESITLTKMTKVSELIENAEYASAVVTDKDGNELEANVLVPHGSYIIKMNNGIAEEKTQIYLLKDVNSDGKTNAADARLALRCSAKLEILNELQIIAADINNDNKVTAADARLILRVPVGPLVTPGNKT